MGMFEVIGKTISLNDIENSFKYAKIYKNKMTFEDFKEYFHNFWRSPSCHHIDYYDRQYTPLLNSTSTINLIIWFEHKFIRLSYGLTWILFD